MTTKQVKASGTKDKATKTADVKAADVKVEVADRDAVFGRFMLTLGQVMRGVQRLKFDPEFSPITALNDDLEELVYRMDDQMVAAYEPLLVAYAATREGGTVAG